MAFYGGKSSFLQGLLKIAPSPYLIQKYVRSFQGKIPTSDAALKLLNKTAEILTTIPKMGLKLQTGTKERYSSKILTGTCLNLTSICNVMGFEIQTRDIRTLCFPQEGLVSGVF